MAINYRDSFKTVTVTKSELSKMCDAQYEGINSIEKNVSDKSTIVANLVGFGVTVLALVFFKSSSLGVASGLVSIVNTATSSMKKAILAQAKNGHIELEMLYRKMDQLGAKSVTMDVAYLEVYDQATAITEITFVQGTLVKKYTY